MSKFSGFPPTLYQFLVELSENNDKDWFETNRERYETEVRGPALAYITALQEPMRQISSEFRVEPKKMGGSLMRIHRDTRFSKDKSPYKTNVGIQLRHATGCDVHAPGYYIHLSPEENFFGVGTWHPAGASLVAIRTAIQKDSREWKNAIGKKTFQDRFELAGESLKRAPQGVEPDHPLIEDLKRKDFIGVQEFDPGLISSKDFVKETVAAFKTATPFMKFLCEALGVTF